MVYFRSLEVSEYCRQQSLIPRGPHQRHFPPLLRGSVALVWRPASLPRKGSPVPSLPAGHCRASTILPALRAAILNADLIGRLCRLTQGRVPKSLMRLIVRDHISWQAWESCCRLSRSMAASSPACTSIFGDRPAHFFQSAGIDLSSRTVFLLSQSHSPSHAHCFLADLHFAAFP